MNNTPEQQKKDQQYLATVRAMNDEDFLKEIMKLHDTFVKYVRDLMRKGGCAKYLFKSIAESLAQSHDYVLLCDRIYAPIAIQERLMKLLNDHQQKFYEFKEAEETKEAQKEDAGKA